MVMSGFPILVWPCSWVRCLKIRVILKQGHYLRRDTRNVTDQAKRQMFSRLELSVGRYVDSTIHQQNDGSLDGYRIKMCTGEFPFSHKSGGKLRKQHIPHLTSAQDIPPRVWRVISQCWNWEPGPDVDMLLRLAEGLPTPIPFVGDSWSLFLLWVRRDPNGVLFFLVFFLLFCFIYFIFFFVLSHFQLI